MPLILKRALLRAWMGAIGVVLAIAAAFTIIGIWGTALGRVWLACAIMILMFFAYAGLQEFLRPPNPYGRLHPLYDMQDIGPTGELHSSGLHWLWNVVPLIVASVELFLTTYWI